MSLLPLLLLYCCYLLTSFALVHYNAGGPRSILPVMGPGKKLLHVVEDWLRKERDARRAKTAAAAASCGAEQQMLASVVPSRTPLMPNKHLAFFR